MCIVVKMHCYEVVLHADNSFGIKFWGVICCHLKHSELLVAKCPFWIIEVRLFILIPEYGMTSALRVSVTFFVMELDTTDILIGKASKLLLLFWKQIWSKFYVIKHYLIVHELSSWPYPYLLIVFPKTKCNLLNDHYNNSRASPHDAGLDLLKHPT